MNHQLYIDHRFKSTNESVILIIDCIHTAIIEKKKIIFQYFDYTPEKKKVYRRGGEFYTVSPYAMFWNNDQYYMAGYSEAKKMVMAYQVDRISHLTVTGEPARKCLVDLKVSDCFRQSFSRYRGEKAMVELLCENALMNRVVDYFGDIVSVQIIDRGHFKVTTSIALSNNFYGWVFSSGGKMRILGPEKAKSQFNTILDNFIINK